MALKLPESEVQGTPLTPEEQRIIVVIGKPSYNCRCSYTLKKEPLDSEGNQPAHELTFAPTKAEDCAVACASACDETGKCDRFNWEYTISYSGKGTGD